MGKKTKISRQADAAGKSAHVHSSTFNQISINQAAPVTYTALHQLPWPSADFVGRKKEIKELLKAHKSGITILGLQGLGGIGKTALALKLAEQLTTSYPDAQFYLDLKGVSKEPLSSAQAMAHIIYSHHPEAKLPDDESHLRAIYYSLLEGKKAILLMDNAANAEQIKPLIPPAGSIMLVTSRNHFTLSGYFIKDLDALEPNDAKQLLLKIAPRIDRYAEKIAELCDYLPLALEVAASAMYKAVNLTPEEYIQRLSKTAKRLELIEASLSLSYDLLGEDLQKLLSALSAFPDSFDDNAVASLWELNAEEAQDRLAELISYSLLEWNQSTHRYHLQNMVRLFTSSRLSEHRHLLAYRAHAIYYEMVLSKTKELYLKGGAEIFEGLNLFDLERSNIEAGQSWASSLLGEDETATHLCMCYYFAGVHILNLRLHPREKIKWLIVTLNAACLLNDRKNEAHALGSLGLAYESLGEIDKAVEFYEKVLLIFRELGDRPGEGLTLSNLGSAYAKLKELRKAIVFQEQYLAIARELSDRRGEGHALGKLGLAYAKLREHRKAIEFYEQRLEIAHELGDRQGEGSGLGNLGLAYFAIGEVNRAIEFYEKRLEIARELGDQQGEGMALWNFALAYNRLGDRTEAISFAEMALVIYEQVGSPSTSKVRSALLKWKAGEG
jgi:tetratricopeptide (TPR) repeat protein